MANLVKAENPQVLITAIRHPAGHIVYHQADINAVFAYYYKDLYGARHALSQPDLALFLDALPSMRAGMEGLSESGGPIQEGEISAAIAQLATGKTPGSNGLPLDFTNVIKNSWSNNCVIYIRQPGKPSVWPPLLVKPQSLCYPRRVVTRWTAALTGPFLFEILIAEYWGKSWQIVSLRFYPH